MQQLFASTPRPPMAPKHSTRFVIRVVLLLNLKVVCSLAWSLIGSPGKSSMPKNAVTDSTWREFSTYDNLRQSNYCRRKGRAINANEDVNAQTNVMVQKNVFYPAACVNDNMLNMDKAVMRYSEHIDEKDRRSMTPEVCFDFCRAQPGMLYFGLAQGNECYCTPYYQMTDAGDKSQCDLACAGDEKRMCGGKKKSSMFEMHTCLDLRADLKDTGSALRMLANPVSNYANQAFSGSQHLLHLDTAKMPKPPNAKGNPAKIGAQLEIKATEVKTLAASAMEKATAASQLSSSGIFTTSKATNKAEELLADMVYSTAKLQVKYAQLEAVAQKASVWFPDMFAAVPQRQEDRKKKLFLRKVIATTIPGGVLDRLRAVKKPAAVTETLV
eukprot:gnl/TRDRNA2_/TRDRNA2_42719_c0_seq1.p1 gnl/TRDRNA2_/TRDRNA2_42719_c0~~gnl/TRDRNA2_/TRDRNA2_42719_c0_seq1.p1  ORF type:complete len:384 (+),score=80.89 gnl/TRDRNA2_/TRDRNA2_42719_c0_seq1:49-1200(+)